MTRRVGDDEGLVVDGDVECGHGAVAHAVDAVEVLLETDALHYARRQDGADLVRVRGRGLEEGADDEHALGEVGLLGLEEVNEGLEQHRREEDDAVVRQLEERRLQVRPPHRRHERRVHPLEARVVARELRSDVLRAVLVGERRQVGRLERAMIGAPCCLARRRSPPPPRWPGPSRFSPSPSRASLHHLASASWRRAWVPPSAARAAWPAQLDLGASREEHPRARPPRGRQSRSRRMRAPSRVPPGRASPCVETGCCTAASGRLPTAVSRAVTSLGW
eukprot:scaffold18890_cov60-Phaeocystis_antarctica.AAC.8